MTDDSQTEALPPSGSGEAQQDVAGQPRWRDLRADPNRCAAGIECASDYAAR